MSPPRCHSGNGDNGTPVFGNTSFSITPVHRHYIFKPRGAEAEPLLALWDGCRCPVVILVIASSQWMCCAVLCGCILFCTVLQVYWCCGSLHWGKLPILRIYSLIVHHAAWVHIMMEFCTECPLYICPTVFGLCTSACSILEAAVPYLQCHSRSFPYIHTYIIYWGDTKITDMTTEQILLYRLRRTITWQQRCRETFSQTAYQDVDGWRAARSRDSPSSLGGVTTRDLTIIRAKDTFNNVPRRHYSSRCNFRATKGRNTSKLGRMVMAWKHLHWADCSFVFWCICFRWKQRTQFHSN